MKTAEEIAERIVVAVGRDHEQCECIQIPVQHLASKEDLYALAQLCVEQTTLVKELSRRQKGQVGMLTRIRKKADVASGLDNDGSIEGNSRQGRSIGAEGAVDLLIARHAELLHRVNKLERASKLEDKMRTLQDDVIAAKAVTEVLKAQMGDLVA